MRIRRGLFALGPSLAAALAAAAVPWLRAQASDLAGAAIWGLSLLVSFVGWGAALLQILGLDRAFAGFGVRAALGMSIVVAIGGVLQLGFWMSPSSAVALLGGGLAALAWCRFRRRELLLGEAAKWSAQVKAAPWFSLLIGALYCVAIFRFLGSLATPVANPWDDFEAYFVFPKALLADGALQQPYSVPRLISLGGHPFLQSLLLAGSSPIRLNGFDGGLCLLTVFGMVDGYARASRAARVLALTFVVGFVYKVHSVNSALSGTVFFLAIFCVIDARAADLKRPSVPLLLGLLSAAAWTMRQNYLVTVLAILGATYAMYAFYEELRVREAGLGLARTLGILTLLLIPWWVVACRSTGTFLYPAVLGNGRADFGLTNGVSVRQELEFFVFNALWSRPVCSLWLFVVAGVSLTRTLKNCNLHAFLLGTGVGGIALLHACRAWDDVESMARFYMAFEVALVLAVLLKCTADVSREGTLTNLRARLALGAVLLGVGAQLAITADEVRVQYSSWMERIAIQLMKPVSVDEEDRVYQRLQQAIPAGASVLEILDQPYRLDFERNRILVCDLPGGSSPPPGLPIYSDVQHYERYFAAHSIRYIAYTLGPESPEYKLSLWLGRLRDLDPKVRTGHTLSTLFRHMAPVYLDVFYKLEQLEQRHATIFREGQIRVLDLASPASQH